MGDTNITGRHIGGGTHITSDMCTGIHISRGYTYHCDRHRNTARTNIQPRVAWVKLNADWIRAGGGGGG